MKMHLHIPDGWWAMGKFRRRQNLNGSPSRIWKGRLSPNAAGEPLPRYRTVYDLVRAIPSGLLTLAQYGSKAYS
jgi:hypothetical protein